MNKQRAPLPPIHGACGVIYTTEDKAEAFAETFDPQCRPVYENMDVNPIVASTPTGNSPGQPTNWPQNYRSISLLSVMSKIADRIILKRLREETDDFDIIPICQFRFRKEHNNTHQVLRAVFLDAKAFDKVWHQELLLKMHRVGIFKAMLILGHTRHSYLRQGHSSSSRKGSGPQSGVPIPPLLFSIYTSDIPANAYVNFSMYADICILTNESLERERSQLNIKD
ncbi:hypothetical protein Trydic_g1798 [Trypoxylus dichotomus]